MIITQATLALIPAMRELVRPEVERGAILERSAETMANMIRSYHIAWASADELEQARKNGYKLKTNSQELGLAHTPNAASNATPNASGLVMLGFCALHIHSTTLGEIRSLIVAPHAQRLGVASALIADCEVEADTLGLAELLVLTYKRALFEKLGFSEIPKDKIPNQKIWQDCIACKHFPLCDEIALTKALKCSS